MNTSDILAEVLVDWGVDTVFGVSGDGINGFMDALRKHQDRTRFVQVRHEQSAAQSGGGPLLAGARPGREPTQAAIFTRL